jgi:hypothetical protein
MVSARGAAVERVRRGDRSGERLLGWGLSDPRPQAISALGWRRFGSFPAAGGDVGPIDRFGFSWTVAVSL